ncbi:hypothetical protein M2322_000004 [Rhodoblastus acidophilus]|uniref:hypothetical protein n=1 Tax=Rhodoblastus acidophilus TaxID=1074 RepID=UPI002223F6D0|nr:hypothetical protein [Rhodoblastus acidophilus]MCW2314484.1 hypothetical protein [Rhodoblastus acidophilus]
MPPEDYRWLEAEPGPRMILEALKEFGVLEAPGAANNPRIIGWGRELQAAGLGRDYGGFYDADAIPWCGLFMAVIALRANVERRPERAPQTFISRRSPGRPLARPSPKDPRRSATSSSSSARAAGMLASMSTTTPPLSTSLAATSPTA